LWGTSRNLAPLWGDVAPAGERVDVHPLDALLAGHLISAQV
jgi:hypothetical protein